MINHNRAKNYWESLHTHCVFTLAETILFTIRSTEDVVSSAVDDEHKHGFDVTELEMREGKIASMEGVHEGNPDEIAEGEHDAKTVCCNIHHC